jgi:hypothetical protein
MPLIFYDPQHWRDRANETRSIADKMTHIDGQAHMLAVAEEYERQKEQSLQRTRARSSAMMRRSKAGVTRSAKISRYPLRWNALQLKPLPVPIASRRYRAYRRRTGK